MTCDIAYMHAQQMTVIDRLSFRFRFSRVITSGNVTNNLDVISHYVDVLKDGNKLFKQTESLSNLLINSIHITKPRHYMQVKYL